MKIAIYIIAAILVISNVQSKLHKSKILPRGAVFENNNSKLFQACYKDTQCIDMKASNQLLCDTQAMECRSRTRCSKSKDCFTNNRCENTFCKSRDICKSTTDCTSDRICIDGQCKKTGTGCSSDRVCKEGQYCHQGVCTNLLAQNCWYDSNCNPGSFCFDGKCIRQQNKKCIADTHCNDGYKCWYDRCRKRCSDAYDCPTSMICNKKLEICKSPSPFGCVFDKDCPLGKKCTLGKCRNKTAQFSCIKSSDCKMNQVCEGQFCLSNVGGTCQTFADCVSPLKCNSANKCFDQSAMDDNGLEIIIKDK